MVCSIYRHAYQEHLSFSSLRKKLSERLQGIYDHRQTGKTRHTIHDVFMSGFAMMYFQQRKSRKQGQRPFIDISQDVNILLYPYQEYHALLLLDIRIILLKGVITDSLFLELTKIKLRLNSYFAPKSKSSLNILSIESKSS
jgi:hypothetical protein